MGFLELDFAVLGRKTTSSLKLVRIMLETFRIKTPYNVSIFLQKITILFKSSCSDITELFTGWWTHDQSQQSNLRQTFVIIILRVISLNLDMFLLTNMVLSKGSLKTPRATILRYFHFKLLIPFFFGSTDLKRVERSRTGELTDF